MIGSLRGQVSELGLETCIIETKGGVGYRVFMAAGELSRLQAKQEVRLYIHTAVREDAILLFGFLTREGYELFLLLLGVSGVGPKVALGILGAIKPSAFYLALRSKDMKVLTKLPGIGKKTAERLVLELKDRVGGFTDSGGRELSVDGGGAASPVAEAIEALASLGYANSEIMPVLEQIPDCASLSAEEILPRALRLFAAKKQR